MTPESSLQCSTNSKQAQRCRIIGSGALERAWFVLSRAVTCASMYLPDTCRQCCEQCMSNQTEHSANLLIFHYTNATISLTDPQLEQRHLICKLPLPSNYYPIKLPNGMLYTANADNCCFLLQLTKCGCFARYVDFRYCADMCCCISKICVDCSVYKSKPINQQSTTILL